MTPPGTVLVALLAAFLVFVLAGDKVPAGLAKLSPVSPVKPKPTA